MTEQIPSLIMITKFFTALSFIIAIILEVLIHKHIIELKLPMKWRLSIYFNVWAILSLEIGVLFHHYQQYIVTGLILFCPIYVGSIVRFLRPIRL